MRKFHNNLKGLLFFILYLLAAQLTTGQENLPKDYLTKEFHAARREAFRKLMPDNSVAVIFSYPERIFSRDNNYTYHANPDLYYLTGYKEPDAVLLLFKENQKNGEASYNEIMYARKRNPEREVWDGRRLGAEGVKKELGFTRVYNSDEFSKLPVNFSSFSKVLYDEIPDDIGAGTLQTAMKTFMEKAKVKPNQSRSTMLHHTIKPFHKDSPH
jgi:Xaa-Pro aminopeptidase